MIQTERLELRLITSDDVDLVFAMFSDPQVAKWSGTGQPLISRDEAIEKTERFVHRGGEVSFAGFFVVTERESGDAVGTCVLVPLPASDGVARDDLEIGWHFLPAAWGHGYATEAGQAMVELAFAHDVDEVFAVTRPDNIASQAVCRRLGMTELGLQGAWYDTVTRAFHLRNDRVG